MKKLITSLFIASAFTFSFAETRYEITSTTTIDSSYNGSAITIPYSGSDWAMDLNLGDVTLSSDDDESGTLYVAAYGSNTNVNGSVVINASTSATGSGNAVYLSGNTIDFNINDGGYLTVNGDLASNLGTNCYVNLYSGGTLELNGTYYAEGSVNLYGTLIVGENGSFSVVGRQVNNDSFLTTPDTFVTFYDGVELYEMTSDNEKIALSTIEVFESSNYKSSVQFYILDNDALASTNINLGAGVWNTNGNNTPHLFIAFTNGTTSVSAGKVEIGSLTINDYNVVHIDLTSIDAADGDSVVMEFLVGDTSTTMTSTATTAEVYLTAFADDIFNIGDSTKLYFDGDNQLYFVITEDGTDYYIKVSVSDVDGTDISTGGFDIVDGFLNVSAVVPEPSTYAVILAGLALGLAMYRRRK